MEDWKIKADRIYTTFKEIKKNKRADPEKGICL